MRQVHKHLPACLVQLDGVALLDELANNLAFLVFDDEHFLGTDHVLDHNCPQVGQDVLILALSERIVGKNLGVWCSTGGGEATNTHGDQWVDLGDGKLLHFLVKLLHQLRPIFKADLEDLAVLDLRYADQVEMGVREVVCVWQFLDKLGPISTTKIQPFG